MGNKKIPLVFMFAFCALQIFAAPLGKVVGKLPKGMGEDSVLRFSHEGEKFYYSYKKGDKFFINADRKQIGPFKEMPYLMAHCEKNFAYVYHGPEGKYHLVLNGKETGCYDDMYLFYFMNNQGNYFLYAKEIDGWYMITKDKKYGPFEKEPDFIQWKKNGSLCFCVHENGADYVWTDGERRGPFKSVDSGIIFSETDVFRYTWCEEESSGYHLCVDEKDSEAYNCIDLCCTKDGRAYYIADSMDLEKSYLICDGKILREIDVSECDKSVVIGSTLADGHCVSIRLLTVAYGDEIAFLLKDGEIKAEMKSEADKSDAEYSHPLFARKWISCPAGRFGPYTAVDDICFDMHGHAVWSARTDYDKCGLYVDGNLIYETDRRLFFTDFEMLGDRFIFIMGGNFDTLNVNGDVLEFKNSPVVFAPRLVPESDAYLYFSNIGDFLGGIICHDGKLYKTSFDEKSAYYIEGNRIRKINLE